MIHFLILNIFCNYYSILYIYYHHQDNNFLEHLLYIYFYFDIFYVCHLDNHHSIYYYIQKDIHNKIPNISFVLHIFLYLLDILLNIYYYIHIYIHLHFCIHQYISSYLLLIYYILMDMYQIQCRCIECFH
jgi:hypothetical protein